MKNGNIWALILAAGESSRMGKPKMLLPFRGSTIIGTLITGIRNAGIENILAVIGAERENLPLLLQKFSVNFCFNNNYREGMLSSVKCGVKNLPADTGAIMVFPGDQPLIAPRTIQTIVKEYQSCNFGILMPSYNGRRGHPLLIDSRYLDEIETLDPDKGLRSLSALHPDDVFEIQVSDPGILKDFDTYEDYLNEINQKS